MRILSLFSGIGAFEKALIELGVKIQLVAYCDVDKYASKSYSILYSVPERYNIGDIHRLNKNNIPKLADFDIMTYGFPCQNYSIAGLRLGFADETKGDLLHRSLEIAEIKQPKYLVAENVTGLLNISNGEVMQFIVDTLDRIGYNTYFKVLNSANFGVPQVRNRVYIVSIRKDIDTHKFEFEDGSPTEKRVKDIVDTSTTKRQCSERMSEFMCSDLFEPYDSNNGIIKLFDGQKQGYTKFGSGNRIYSINGYCNTLVTKPDGSSFYELDGYLNSLERFRLQGFTDEDHAKLVGKVSETQLIKQAGNTITVPVLKSVLRNLLVAQDEYRVNSVE